MVELKNWRVILLNVKRILESSSTNLKNNQIISSRYTWLTFLPKVFIEHFRRLSNIFFLSLIILQLSLSVSVPTNPSAYIVAFSVVLSVSTIRQAYEDWVRHRSDDKTNKRKIMRFDYAKFGFEVCLAENLDVGHIVKLIEDENVPADILLLGSVSQGGTASSKIEITTANLDGETNRKFRFSPVISEAETMLDESDFLNIITKQSIELEYEQPNADLYQFNGIIKMNNEVQQILSIENIILRGTTVKNCKNAYGCVIYTGSDTRLSMNSVKSNRNKFSIVDQTTNRIVFILFVVLLVFTSISLGIFFYMRSTHSFTKAWYIPDENQTKLWISVITFSLFLVFLSYMIPISLSISIEIQKVACSIFFGWDEDMKCEKLKEAAVCNTSDLNEELGQIEYILTDKTGTLTENKLEFIGCSVNGQKYNYIKTPTYHLIDEEFKSFNGKEICHMDDILEFLQALSLCHTVRVIETVSVPKHYQGSSADEEALVEFAKKLGVIYQGENIEGKHITEFQYNQRNKLFKRHHILHFDSDRKCMSVILEDEEKRFFLITKGAESILLPKCKSGTDCDTFNSISNHVDEFAEKGYRTLIVTKKELSQEEFKGIDTKLKELHQNLEKLQQFYCEVESDLNLLGATAVVDKLQDRVNETLTCLKEAGIKIWMLTGDKQETAVSTAISSGLMSNNSIHSRFYISNITNADILSNQLQKIQQSFYKDMKNSTLIIDGISFAVGFENCRELLASVAKQSSEVILCRMTPLQKAQVVRLIKETGMERICAVGDGGNDVAMIQEAHIGIGIFGREGRQASRAADFAVPQFQHLQKAILVHGSWFYFRLTTLVNYFFYRGILFVLPQFLYGFDSGFSGQTVYDASFMMCYSLLFAALPIVLYGIYEQHDSVDGLLQNPIVYKTYRNNSLMRRWALVKWSGVTLWHIIIIFYVPRLVLKRYCEEMDWAVFSHLINNLVVAVTVAKVASITVYFPWMVLLAQIFSFSSMIIFYTLSSEILGTGSLGYAYFKLLKNPEFWGLIILITALSIIPDLIEGGFRRLRYLKRNQDFLNSSRKYTII